MPDDPAALQKLFGIAGPESPALKLQDALQLPSLNVRGLSSGFVGADARTIIPDKAIADIDIRLVKETPAERQLDLVIAHIRRQGWHLVTADPDDDTRAKHAKIVKVSSRGDGTNAYRTSPLLPVSRQLVRALTEYWAAPVEIRTMGGSCRSRHLLTRLGFRR